MGSAYASRRRPVVTRRALVLLDTNALFLSVRRPFPLEAELDRLCPGAIVAVPSIVLGELDRLAKRGTPGASTARKLASRYPVVLTSGTGDEAVMRAAVRLGSWVITADRVLREALRRQGVTVLFPRDRHRLERFEPRPARPSRRTPDDRRTAKMRPPLGRLR